MAKNSSPKPMEKSESPRKLYVFILNLVQRSFSGNQNKKYSPEIPPPQKNYVIADRKESAFSNEDIFNIYMNAIKVKKFETKFNFLGRCKIVDSRK